ncbi:T9SS type A sorting domain-containing protein [Winogradskyella sediminis]
MMFSVKKVYTTTSNYINISEQEDGVYFLKIHTNDTVVNKQLLKN